MRTRWIAVSLLLAACAPEAQRLHSAPPWPPSHTVVLLAVDARGAPLGAPLVFGPAEVVQLPLPEQASRLVAFTYAQGQGLLQCGVRIGGTQAALPTADQTYGSGPLPADTLVFTALSEAPFDLRFDRCTPAAQQCPRFEVTRIDAPEVVDQDLVALAWAPDGQLYVAPSKTVRGAPYLLRVDAGPSLVALPSDPAWMGGGLRAFSAQEGGFVGVSDRSLIELDAQARVRSATTAPEDPAGLLDLGPDDRLVFGATGLVAVRGATEPIFDPVLSGLFVEPDLVLALTSQGILRRQGTQWGDDYVFGELESWQALGGDGAAQVAVNQVGQVLLRRGPGVWENLGTPPAPPQRLRAAAGLGAGRVVVAGNYGFFALWTGARWCVPPVVVANTLLAVVSEADGETFWIASASLDSVQGDLPFLLRVRLIAP